MCPRIFVFVCDAIESRIVVVVVAFFWFIQRKQKSKSNPDTINLNAEQITKSNGEHQQYANRHESLPSKLSDKMKNDDG